MAIFPTRDEIERRAYEIYLRRGSRDGSDLEDWLVAEKELFQEYSISAQKRASALIAERTRFSASDSPRGRAKHSN